MEIELTIPGYPSSSLTVRQYDIVEALSTPFEVALAAMSHDPDLDFERIVGQPATFTLGTGVSTGARVWSGVCSYVEQIEAESTGESSYAIRIVPRLWLLSQRRGNRVFQHQTAIEIAHKLLTEHKIDFIARVTEGSLARHELRAQYGETDLDFLTRLLEEAGLSYLYEGAVIVVTDAPERAASSAFHTAVPVVPLQGLQARARRGRRRHRA